MPGTVVTVMVRSSMKALIGGCRAPDLVNGPLHSTSADFTTMFMARKKRVTEMVQPVMIPFSNRCQSEVEDPAVILKLL